MLPLVRKDGQPEVAREIVARAARADADRVRRGRLDRQALPPPGRDRHAVLRHGRPPDARGPHGHGARPRLARAGARRDRRARGPARGAPRRAVAVAEARHRAASAARQLGPSSGRADASHALDQLAPEDLVGLLLRPGSPVCWSRCRPACAACTSVPACGRHDPSCDRADRLRRSLRALGARQLGATEIDFTQDRVALAARSSPPQQRTRRAVALLAVLPRRGLGRRQPLAVHRRGAAGGAEVLPRDAAGRRGAPRRVLPPLHARGRRRRRRRARRRPARDRARS